MFKDRKEEILAAQSVIDTAADDISGDLKLYVNEIFGTRTSIANIEFGEKYIEITVSFYDDANEYLNISWEDVDDIQEAINKVKKANAQKNIDAEKKRADEERALYKRLQAKFENKN